MTSTSKKFLKIKVIVGLWKVNFSIAKLLIKGYLRYKKITSQNGSSEAQVKVFLFHRKVMFCSHYVFVFLNIPGVAKSVTS